MKDVIHKNYSGSTINVANPEGNEYLIEDIAHQLALTNRFRGTTNNPVSVAHHSLSCAVTVWVDQDLAKVALMHDAAEAYLCDMPYHLKGFFPEFEEMHDRLLMDIFNFFDLEWWRYDSDTMRQLDQDVGIAEMRSQMLYDTSDLPEVPKYVQLIEPLHWHTIEDRFIEAWEALSDE